MPESSRSLAVVPEMAFFLSPRESAFKYEKSCNES
jgi:hypothetical protein